jgi:hypothetical protein
MQINVGGRGAGGVAGLWGGCSGCMGAVTLLLVFGGVGAGLSWWGWTIVQSARASAEWPTVEGRITRSVVRHSTDAEGGDSYSPEVAYTYAVSGRAFEGERIKFGENSYGSRSRAEAIAAGYPVGRQVEVYYEPANPSNAVLEPGLSAGSYIVLGIGLLFICIAGLTAPLSLLPRLLQRR